MLKIDYFFLEINLCCSKTHMVIFLLLKIDGTKATVYSNTDYMHCATKGNPFTLTMVDICCGFSIELV